MTETQKRIKAYQKLLPELRERVIAVALLLAMSTSMLSSASFAWLTISRRPEVTNISTNIAANGNLEVALATGDIETPSEPAVSKEGDSAATEGQSVAAANTTWGNLVNLADPSYGLENLTLRPAELNVVDLDTSPLIAAVYKSDGRVSGTSDDFAYTSWVPPEVEGAEGYFGEATGLGVRGISSVKRQMTAFEETADIFKGQARQLNNEAKKAFISITEEKAWMDALARMMGTHMTASLNGEDKYQNAVVSEADLKSLIDMYDAFIAAYEVEAKAFAHLINWQLYLANGGNQDVYTPWQTEFEEGSEGTNPIFTVATATKADAALGINAGDLVVNTITDPATGKTKVVKIEKLATFQKDYSMLVRNVAKMRTIRAGGDYRWTASGLQKIVSELVNIDTCLIKKKSDKNFMTIKELQNSLGSNPLGATSWMNADVVTKITNGVLYDFDQLVGAGVEIKNLSISAKMYVASMSREFSASLNATISTSADVNNPDFESAISRNREAELNTGADDSSGALVAQDTYGLAIDLWVRTNAPDTHLILEGNVLTDDSNYEPVMVTDINGDQTQLHTLTRTVKVQDENGNDTGEEITNTFELYKIENKDKVATWYIANNHEVFTLEDGESPTPKQVQVPIIIGYQGANRVWDKSVVQSVDATTQGSGSCYIYYANTPEDQARSMELLKALHVAFIDAGNNLLAVAGMDTANSYEDGGRTIVPLVLDSKSNSVTVGDNTYLTITQLEQNVATRITAIVYLDGSALTNDKVLSSGDIQGQLNIQFGSSEPLTPIRNLKLETAERTVTATVSPSSFKFETDSERMTSTVELKVNGDAPNNVQGFFMRQISSTQGTPEDPMVFTYDTVKEAWIAQYTFKSPGTYVLRSVQLDGQEQLIRGDLPTVTIEGFGISSLTWSEKGNNVSVMTADNIHETDVTVQFSGEKQPRTVEGHFIRGDGNVVNVNFKQNSTGMWEGKAVFRSSGLYKLDMLIVDGDYVEIEQGLRKSMDIKLGMYASIDSYDDIGTFLYLPDQMTPEQKLIEVDVDILDNTGNVMTGFPYVKLVYGIQSAASRIMDTDLEWNPQRNCYTGYLKATESGGPGTWVFRRVEVTSGASHSIITRAPDAPVFNMIPPNEPSWVGISEKQSSFVSVDGGAFMQVDIKDSQTATATVMATIQDQNGNSHAVQGEVLKTEGDITTWKFMIPKREILNSYNSKVESQNGVWTMTDVEVWDYYRKNQEFVGKDGDYLHFTDKIAAQNYSMTVVHTVDVLFPANDGNGGETATRKFDGIFMQEHTVDGVNIQFRVPGITKLPDDVKFGVSSMSYTYDGNTGMGDYKVQSGNTLGTGEGAAFTMTFGSKDGVNFLQTAGEVALKHAGTYTPHRMQYSVIINGVSKGYSFEKAALATMKAPKIEVRSEQPTVKITGVSPDKTKNCYYYTAQIASDGTVGRSGMISGSANNFSDYSAMVYIYANSNESRSTYAPSVSLTLSGMPSTEFSAQMSFGNAATGTPVTYTFNTNGQTVTEKIGERADGSGGIFGLGATEPKIFPAGKQEASLLTVTMGETVYAFTLDNKITIHQPQYPMAATFADIKTQDASFTGSTPGKVYTTDGETIVVTLPTLSSWDQPMSETKNQDFTVQSGYPKTANVYTERDSGCDTYYQPYIETTTVSVASSSTTSWTRTKTITGWRIGSTTYKPGDVVTLTSSQTITAVISHVDGPKTTESSTTTRTEKVYTANGSEVKNDKPSGTKVTSVENTVTDVVS